MQWQNPHFEVLLWRRLVSHVVSECEPMVSYLIHP